MSAIFVADRAGHSVPGLHDAFLTTIVPAVETVAHVRFLGLPVGENKENWADVVATAMLFVVRLAARAEFRTEFA